jgi:O-antigen/teichoic acid export membrane protein
MTGGGWRHYGARLRRSRLVGQGAGYAASEAAVAVLGGISTALVARGLSTHDFGSQAFAISFLLLTSLFFDFGLSLPAGRLTALRPASGQRQVAGAALLAFVPIGVLFSGAVFGMSFGVDSLFHVNAGHPLRLIAPLALVYPFRVLAGYLTQGVDRLHIYSVTSVVGQALYLAALGVLALVHVDLTLTLALELRLAAMVVSSIVLVAWLSPVFRGAIALVPQLVEHARTYGFKAYVGSVLGIATYNMDVLMLGAFTNAESVGYYGLAGSVAYLVSLPVYGLSKALFARMTSAPRLDGRFIAFAWASGLTGAAVVIVLAHPVIPLAFSHRYAPAVALILPLALAETVRGVTTVYNAFLSGQGRGRELRSAALVLTSSNLALNFALIPPFGAQGAAWASVGALVVNLAAHILLYRRLLRAPRGRGYGLSATTR